MYRREFILRVLLSRKIYHLLKRNEQTHLQNIDDKRLISCRCYVFIWRCFEMHEWFFILNYVEFLLFFCFNIALKTSCKIFINVINAFFVFIECFIFKRKMFACTEISCFVISTNFVDVIIFLVMKTLFNFEFFSKYSQTRCE
jgi:hypothetical protein